MERPCVDNSNRQDKRGTKAHASVLLLVSRHVLALSQSQDMSCALSVHLVFYVSLKTCLVLLVSLKTCIMLLVSLKTRLVVF